MIFIYLSCCEKAHDNKEFSQEIIDKFAIKLKSIASELHNTSASIASISLKVQTLLCITNLDPLSKTLPIFSET